LIRPIIYNKAVQKYSTKVTKVIKNKTKLRQILMPIRNVGLL